MSYSIFNPMTKEGVLRDQKYLNFIAKQTCMCPGCSVRNRVPEDGLIAYHHFKGLKGGGMSIKPPDFHAIPLCQYHHNLVHQMGMSALNLDIECILKSILGYLIEYIQLIKEAS